MRRDFKIALLAHPGAFIDQVVREFGIVSEVGTEGWPADSEAVIFDCAHADISRHREAWCRVLEAGSTLGVIGIQAEDRAVLEGIVDRPLKASIFNLFVRRFNADPRRYRYTILPDVARVEGMEPADVATFLSERVFTTDSHALAKPPDEIDNIWPLKSQFSSLRATHQKMIVDWSNGGSWGWPFPTGLASNATLNSEGYFFLANGEGGNNHYHVIILHRLSGVSPMVTSWHAGSYPLFGFGIRVAASYGGQLLEYPTIQVNPTQPINANTPVPQNWGYIGGFICTELGSAAGFGASQPVSIKTMGRHAESSLYQTCEVTPLYQKYRNQVTTPGIGNFYVAQVDTLSQSEVQFNMWPGPYSPGNSATKIQLKPESEPGQQQSGIAPDDDFVAISYLEFKDTMLLPSYIVDFLFTVSFYAEYGGTAVSSDYPTSTSVDLVKATELTPLT